MKKLLQCIIVILFVGFFQLAQAQNTSNKGKDFWVAYTGHVDDLTSRLTLFLSADQITNYEIYIGNTLVKSSSIAPNTAIAANSCLPFTINPNDVPVYIGSSDVVEDSRAIHVITDKPISLYSVISNNARTGGTMVLPSNTLGKEYYTFSYQSSNSNVGNQQQSIPVFAEFTIIATEDATEIEITPTQDEKNGRHFANVPFTKILNKGEIYQYQAVADLSGSHVKTANGCKPIAVFSGNTWASFCQQGGPRGSSGDNLYQQLFPLSAWGKKFVTAPFYNTINGNADILKVIISQDATTITINGTTTLYNKGVTSFTGSILGNVISADKPISVAQYQTSQNCNINNPNNNSIKYPGDPEITVLNPVEQTLSNITVFSDLKAVVGDLTNIDMYFLNVIIKTVDASSFRLDGKPVTGFTPIDSEYSYVIIDVTGTQPQHRLTAASGFSAIAYGYGYLESYAYLAGANIQNFTFQPENAITNQPISVGCVGQDMKLKINLPYQPTLLVWDLGNGDGVVSQSNPVAQGTFNKDGIDYYSYFYPNPITYIIPKDYTFKVIATKPSADACGATEDLSVDFTVDPLPTSSFTAVDEKCASQEVTFTDTSNPNIAGKIITKWAWDFGDPNSGALNTSTDQNPNHTYTKEGVYTVKLSVGAENGCMSSIFFPQDITIYPVPAAKFTVPNTCIKTSFVFTDASTISTAVFSDAKIVNWHWDFGDGKSEDRPDATSPNHQYDLPNTYTVTLTTTSNKGCTSTVSHPIVVTGLPKADFITPDFCLTDGFANFTNKSKDQNGTEVGLTYLWEFGDPSSGSANYSTLRDGRHAYASTGNYSVKLIITNVNGCTDEKSYPFTVNGAVINANFDVKNKSNLCSNNPVIINSTSEVAFGKVTKLEIYQDFLNNPTSFITIPYPKLPISDDIALTYPSFGGNMNKMYTIKLVAYSGESCSLSFTDEIILKPSPQLTFATISSVCENIGNVIINQASENSEMIGDGVYSGPGVKLDGTFDPKLAGAGSHRLTYTFTPQDGCPLSIGQDIEVYPVPSVYAGSDFYILAGGQKQISATAKGNGLTYKWSPSIGLSADDVLNPIASPEKDTKYTLTVKSSQECKVYDDVYVYVLQNVNAPNSFTPNGDGINDVWNVKYLDTYPNANVEIYNRNGERIYFSKGYAVPFDGNYKNQPLPVGTYYYIINPNSGRKSITGNLTIIR